jgi:hypothetical protein
LKKKKKKVDPYEDDVEHSEINIRQRMMEGKAVDEVVRWEARQAQRKRERTTLLPCTALCCWPAEARWECY